VGAWSFLESCLQAREKPTNSYERSGETPRAFPMQGWPGTTEVVLSNSSDAVSAHNRRARETHSRYLLAHEQITRRRPCEYSTYKVDRSISPRCPARGSTRRPFTMPLYPILLGIFTLVLVVAFCLIQRRSSVDDKIPKISAHLIVGNNNDAFQHQHHPNVSEGITYSRTMIDFAADGKFYCLGWFRLFFVVC